MKYYCVVRGRVPGIYSDWASCSAQVHKHKGSHCKVLNTYPEAQKYMRDHLSRPHIDNYSPAFRGLACSWSPSSLRHASSGITEQAAPSSGGYPCVMDPDVMDMTLKPATPKTPKCSLYGDDVTCSRDPSQVLGLAGSVHFPACLGSSPSFPVVRKKRRNAECSTNTDWSSFKTLSRTVIHVISYEPGLSPVVSAGVVGVPKKRPYGSKLVEPPCKVSRLSDSEKEGASERSFLTEHNSDFN